MFKSILLASHSGESSRRAAQIAGDLARSQPAATLWITHVAEPIPSYLGEPLLHQFLSARKRAGQAIIDEAVRLVGPAPAVFTEVVFGAVPESLIRVADARDCDLIVIGSRGRSATGALVPGDLTHKVIRLAHTPVLVVRPRRIPASAVDARPALASEAVLLAPAPSA